MTRTSELRWAACHAVIAVLLWTFGELLFFLRQPWLAAAYAISAVIQIYFAWSSYRRSRTLP